MDSTTAESGAILWGMGWGGLVMLVFALLVLAALVKGMFFSKQKDRE